MNKLESAVSLYKMVLKFRGSNLFHRASFCSIIIFRSSTMLKVGCALVGEAVDRSHSNVECDIFCEVLLLQVRSTNL